MKKQEQIAEKPLKTARLGSILAIVGSYVCIVLVFVAFVVFWETIDNIDVDGTTKEEYKQYDPLIELLVYTGLMAVPVGFGLGIYCLFSRSPDIQAWSLPPIFSLGILLLLFCMMQGCVFWQNWNGSTGEPVILLQEQEYPSSALRRKTQSG